MGYWDEFLLLMTSVYHGRVPVSKMFVLDSTNENGVQKDAVTNGLFKCD